MNKGKQAELLARKFLERQGLSFLAANFSRRYGEVDLIMLDKDTTVFIEVKYRSSEAYGTTLEQVTLNKQRKIKMVAQAYLQKYPERAFLVRFDVVGITPQGQGYSYKWVKGAFE